MEKYELLNGLMNLGRDILMRLIRMMDCEQKIRNTVGISEVFYLWSKLNIFHWARSLLGFVWSSVHKSSGIDVLNKGKTAKKVEKEYSIPLSHTVVIHHRKIVRGTVTVAIQIVCKPGRSWYMIEVLPVLPKYFNNGMAMYDSGIGLSDGGRREDFGIFYEGKKLAPSSSGFKQGDIVTMRVDVGRGDLAYQVNGVSCAALQGNKIIKQGVYLAAQLVNQNAEFSIVSVDAADVRFAAESIVNNCKKRKKKEYKKKKEK